MERTQRTHGWIGYISMALTLLLAQGLEAQTKTIHLSLITRREI